MKTISLLESKDFKIKNFEYIGIDVNSESVKW